MKEGLVRYHYHVRRDTWNDRLEPKGQAETLRQKDRARTTLRKSMAGGLDNTLENNGRDCTEEVTYLPYTRRPVSNLSGERTEADKK